MHTTLHVTALDATSQSGPRQEASSTARDVDCLSRRAASPSALSVADLRSSKEASGLFVRIHGSETLALYGASPRGRRRTRRPAVDGFSPVGGRGFRAVLWEGDARARDPS